MEDRTYQYRKATIRLLAPKSHDGELINNVLHKINLPTDTILDVVFDGWDDPEMQKNGVLRVAHVKYLDTISLNENDFELLALSLPQKHHPDVEQLMKLSENAEQMVQNITNG